MCFITNFNKNLFFKVEYNRVLYCLIVALRTKHKLEKNNRNNEFRCVDFNYNSIFEIKMY